MAKKGKGHSYLYECRKGNGWHLSSQKPPSVKNTKTRKKVRSRKTERGHS